MILIKIDCTFLSEFIFIVFVRNTGQKHRNKCSVARNKADFPTETFAWSQINIIIVVNLEKILRNFLKIPVLHCDINIEYMPGKAYSLI